MRVHAVVWIFLAASVPNAVSAQTVFKCLEGRSVTYSNTPCEKLGLKSGGEVPDRVTTVPATKLAPARDTSEPAKKPPAAKAGNEVDLPKSATVKPVSPLIEKLAK